MIKYDSKFDAFIGEVPTAKNTYNMMMADFKEEEQQDAATLAQHIANWLDQQLDSVKNFAAAKLLNLKNKTWLEEGESPITETEFIKTIGLEGITAYPAGDFEIFFHDNGLFFGHDLCIKVGKDFTLVGVSI